MASSLRRCVLVVWLLGGLPAVRAAEVSPSVRQAEPSWVQARGGGLVQWGKAQSQTFANTGQVAPSSVRLTTAVFGAKELILAVWPSKGGKQAAWFGERLLPAQAKMAALVTLWQGSVGAQDADGEVRTVVELTPQGLLRYQQTAGVRHCDAQPVRLFAERFDHTQKRFVAHESPPASPAVELVPSTEPSAPQVAPHTRDSGFRFTTASAPADTPGDARTLRPPYALTNSDGTGGWLLPREQATGAFATARGPQPLPITGLILSAASQTPWPSELRVTLGPEHAFRVDLRAAAASERVWLALPAPVESSCLTVQVVGAQAAARVGLSYVGVVTALDGSEGVAFLADRLATGHSCDAHVRLMKTHALDTVELASALVARLPSASAPGQLCALQALSAMPAARVPPPASWLPEALPTLLPPVARATDPMARREQLARLTTWLDRAGAPTAQALGQVAQAPGVPAEVQALAASLLAQSPHEAFQAVLIDVLLAPGLVNAEALRSAVAGSGGQWVPRLAAMLGETDPQKHPDRAAHILWLLRWRQNAENEPQRWLPLAQRWAQDSSLAFVVRARAVAALGEAGASAHETLAALMAKDPDPVMRFLALQALAQAVQQAPSNTPLHQQIERALFDRDPRVRQTASTLWASAPVPVARQHVPALVRAFEAERWPFVLPAHLKALGRTCAAQTQLVWALEQIALPVDAHVVALEGLAECQLPAAREQALRWLKRQTAPLPVRLAAAQTLDNVAKPQDAQVLLRTLTQLVGSAATDPALDELAVAVLQTLTPLNPESALAGAKNMLSLPRARPRQAALRAFAALCGPEATSELERHSKSTDAGLATAAQQSLRQCESRER